MNRIITLTTDFGLKDAYVGVMKGVILRHCPSVQIVDLSHYVPAQNIAHAARLLNSSYRFFADHSIHLAIVDPGVGTDRAILIVEAAGQVFIAPDNGLLTPILTSDSLQACYRLNTVFDQPISNTFHGRDLMAPLAGKIAAGTDIRDLAISVMCEDCVLSTFQEAKRDTDSLRGEIIEIDHFGNVITSITANDIDQLAEPSLLNASIEVENIKIDGLVTSYKEAAPGTALALINSSGYLEIAINCGNASKSLNIKIGNGVVFRYS